jgi:hypothetical protein
MDMVTNLCLNLVFSIGSFVVYKSFSGVYYIYRYWRPINTIVDYSESYIVLSESEYKELVNNGNVINEIDNRLKKIETNLDKN